MVAPGGTGIWGMLRTKRRDLVPLSSEQPLRKVRVFKTAWLLLAEELCGKGSSWLFSTPVWLGGNRNRFGFQTTSCFLTGGCFFSERELGGETEILKVILK